MQTYWLEITRDGSYENSSAGGSSCNEQELGDDNKNIFDPKTLRLIEWNVDVLLRLLKQIVARRKVYPPEERMPPNETYFSRDVHKMSALDEVKEIISLPKFRESAVSQEDPENIELPNGVAEQLHDYVCNIAAIYHDNSFHNFEHVRDIHILQTQNLTSLVGFPCDHVGCETSFQNCRSKRVCYRRTRLGINIARSHVRELYLSL